MGKITKKYDWGYSVVDFHGLKYVTGSDFKQQIHTIATALIRPRKFVPLHIKLEDAEQYQALSWELHALVLSVEEAMKLTDAEILKRVKKTPALKINEVSTCEPGMVHILYNSSDIEARFKIIKYFQD